jgi:hypothetical protein
MKLDIDKKILIIKYSDEKERAIIFFHLSLVLYDNLKCINKYNEKITLYNILEKYENIDNGEFCVKLERIFVGIHTDDDIIDNISRVDIEIKDIIVGVDEFNSSYNNYEIFLKSKVISIMIKNAITKTNKEYFKDFFDIYQFLAICIGYFPRISKIKLYREEKIIEEYGELVYMYDSSFRILNNKFSLINFSSMNNFGKLIDNWVRLREKLGRYPILGLFVSQMKYNAYTDYMLVNLLQSIDGYATAMLKEKMLLNKTEKDIKIIKFLTEKVIELNLNSNDSSKITKYIENYHNPTFENYLRSLMERNRYTKFIFFEEELLNQVSNSNECCLYENKNNCITKAVNERNKISHMTNKEPRKLYSVYQQNVYYYKWLIFYRIIILEDIGVTIDEENLKICLDKMQKNNRKYGFEICNTCRYRENCIIDYKKFNDLFV